MNLFLLILVDLVLIGAALLVFALFHHVIPRQEQAVGIMSQRVSSVITATPVPMATDKPTPEPTSLPTPEPTPEPTQEPTPEPTQEPAQEPAQKPSEAPVEKVLIAADGGAEDSAAASAIPEITAAPEPTLEITATPEVTATPEPAATPAPELVAVDVTRVPTPTPDATPDPVGYFGTKYARRFNADGSVEKDEADYVSGNISLKNTCLTHLFTKSSR